MTVRLAVWTSYDLLERATSSFVFMCSWYEALKTPRKCTCKSRAVKRRRLPIINYHNFYRLILSKLIVSLTITTSHYHREIVNLFDISALLIQSATNSSKTYTECEIEFLRLSVNPSFSWFFNAFFIIKRLELFSKSRLGVIIQ